jgi:uncharacterized membrane protein YfcA
VIVDWYLYPLVVAAGCAAGFINTLAGSGSLITLPVLIFIGLPANVANGTNRVAILLQNVVGVGSFYREGVLKMRRALALVIPATLGSIVGAQIAIGLNEQLMRRAIGVVMVIMLAVILLRPKRWLEGQPDRVERGPGWQQLALFFGIGIYGGFLQAGVGIFLLAGLVLSAGYDLVRANAVKAFIVLCYTFFALGVFVLNNQVRWDTGLLLAAGNMLGAWIATRVAVDKGAVWVHRLLVGVVVVAAAQLLGLFGLAASLF